MILMAKKNAGQGKTRQVNLRFNERMIARLKAIGEPLGLEVPDVVRRAVEEYVERRDPQQPPAQRR